MLGAYKDLGYPELSFTEWMKFGVPVTVTMVLFIWVWLSRNISGKERIALPHPGSWRKPEVRTLLVFGLTALAWITRSEPFGGWKTWLDLPQANDASVAFVAVIFLFCLPNGEKKGERLLDWKTANQIPWGMLVLVGAGLCLGRLQAIGLKRHHRKRLFRYRESPADRTSTRYRLTRDLSNRDD